MKKPTYRVTIVQNYTSKTVRTGLTHQEAQREKKRLMKEGKNVFIWAE